ncbi:hypothetical protein BGZ49_000884, partial [Haplosporangium sp. Z 27]
VQEASPGASLLHRQLDSILWSLEDWILGTTGSRTWLAEFAKLVELQEFGMKSDF